MKELTLSEVAEFLLHNDNYVIMTHRRPDGDTIGCAAALCGGLRKLGKSAWVFENPQFTPKYRPYLENLTTEAIAENACVVSVDIATEHLMPLSAGSYVNRVELLIDHHGTNSGFAAMGYVRAEAAACGEIVLDLLKQMNVEIDPTIAEALYLAISTDTGCFRFSNVTAQTLRAAAYCKECGADAFAINQTMFMTKRIARLRLEAYLTETTEFLADGLVAISMLPNVIRRELGITEDDIDDISGFGREIDGVGIAVMVRQEGENAKISVRTSPNYDAAAICARLGGGGHKAAAGATVSGGIDDAKSAVLQVLAQMGVNL